MMKPSDYFLTPRDVWALMRGWGPRDWRGIALSLAIGAAIGLWLSDLSAGLFVAGLVGALYWRIDSRWPLGAALVLLVLIPVTQFLYDHNIAILADSWGKALAVAVWYLLAIGVVRQIVELRRGNPAAEAPVAAGETSPATPAPSASASASASAPTVPARPLLRLSKRQQRAIAYRVLGRIERVRRGMDGIYRHIKS